MHTLIIDKTTKVIYQSRFDNSTGEKMTLNQVKEFYCKDNNIDQSLVEAVEIPFTEFVLDIGKYVYVNNKISINPDWSEPPKVESQNIPVSST